MPIEIRELHIRTTVGREDGAPDPEPRVASGEVDQEAIVSECVAQVLEILRRKAER